MDILIGASLLAAGVVAVSMIVEALRPAVIAPDRLAWAPGFRFST
jgi:hypothetical protein